MDGSLRGQCAHRSQWVVGFQGGLADWRFIWWWPEPFHRLSGCEDRGTVTWAGLGRDGSISGTYVKPFERWF